MADQRSRRWVNGFLAVFLPVLLIDAFHTLNDSHQALKDAIDYPLDITGLWQGPWRLYAPDVPNDNRRVRAEIVFADQATATWSSPEWSQRSALYKFVEARHINYLNSLLVAGKELAWDGLCGYLARTVPHPQGKAIAVAQVTLSLRGARIPPPSEKLLPAGPYLAFDDWQVIWVWRPPS